MRHEAKAACACRERTLIFLTPTFEPATMRGLSGLPAGGSGVQRQPTRNPDSIRKSETLLTGGLHITKLDEQLRRWMCRVNSTTKEDSLHNISVTVLDSLERQEYF